MYITPRTSTVYVALAAAVVALVLLTSTTLTASVYATRIHHRSIEDMPTSIEGYQPYGNNPVSYQAYGPQLAGQAYGNGPVADQAYGNNPGVDQINGGSGGHPGPTPIHADYHHHGHISTVRVVAKAW